MRTVWFITGGASGIGAGIALAALAAGHDVVASDLDAERLAAVYAEYPAQVLTARLDIRDEAQAEQVVAAALARFGRIDVLVNNAGYGLFGAFEEHRAAAIERQFATNVFGTFNVTRAVLPVMRRQRAGYVINMSSNGGIKGVKGASLYSSSKFAIEGFSESLAQEIAAFGIRLTIVEPGAFRTEFLDSRVLQLGTDPLPDYDAFRSTIEAVFEARNQKQPGDPHKLGQALVQLASEANPPLRFVAGADALAVVDDKLHSVAADVQQWRTLSASTSFD
jgi:NAD(P)-dependent dehydrogenase (short-subunit alcohol dehydrogenase family)